MLQMSDIAKKRNRYYVVFIGARLDDFGPESYYQNFSPFIGMQYVASEILEAGYKVKLFDQRIYSSKDIMDFVSDYHNDILMIGFTVMTVQIKHSLLLSKEIKRLYPKIKIVWGGIHPTLYPEQVINNENIDVVVVNEGVGVVLELLDGILANSGWDSINGIYYKGNGKIIRNPKRKLIEFNDYPYINHSLLPMSKLINVDLPYLGQKRTWHVNLADGCPYKCTFCVVNAIEGKNRVRRKSLERIEKEIRELKDKFDIEFVRIRDDNFFINISWAEKVASIFKKYRMQWDAQSRANYFRKTLTRERLLRFKDCGCTSIAMGIESGSPKILKMLRKEINPEDVIGAARLLKETGIVSNYSFMIGLPEETIDDMEKTIQLIVAIKKIDPRARFAGPMLLRPYPSGELFQQLLKYGYKFPDRLEEWAATDFDMVRGISIKRMCWLGKRERIYAVGISRFLPGYISVKNKQISFWSWLYKRMSDFRIRRRFFRLSLEYEIYRFAKKYRLIRRDLNRDLWKCNIIENSSNTDKSIILPKNWAHD